MQVSDKEIKKILMGNPSVVSEIEALMEGIDDPTYEIDSELVAEITDKVMRMPDREDRIAELKAKIESGNYNPTSAEIVDSMIRRAIADSVK